MTSGSKLLTALAEIVLTPQGLELGTIAVDETIKSLQELAHKHGLTQVSELLPVLRLARADSAIYQDVLGILIDSKSAFFSPFSTYKFLRGKVLSKFIKAREKVKRLRIISVGCGAGQELYSLAILIDAAVPALKDWKLEFMGIDISEHQIERARLGLYGRHELKGDVPNNLREKYFQAKGTLWQLNKAITKSVEFTQANILEQPELLADADLIFLRHVRERLSPEKRKELEAHISNHLLSHGVVVVGPKETLKDTRASWQELKKGTGCFATSAEASMGDGSRMDIDGDDQQALKELLTGSHLFQDLPPTMIDKISSRFELHNLDVGYPLVTQGKPNEAFFIIYEGSVPVTLERSIFQKDLVLARLGPGDCCGEMSLLMGEPCSASVITDEPTKVFAASGALFEFLRKKHKGFNQYMVTLLKERREATELSKKSPGALATQSNIPEELLPFQVSQECIDRLVARSGVQLPITSSEFKRLTSIVRKMALFQDMEVGKIESFVQLMQFWRFSDEAVIVKVKDEGLGLYIVDSGELVVRKGSGFMRKGESVATLKGGQIFGELSILTFTPSNADVIAKGNVALFIMGRELFRHLADGNKSFYESINEVAKKRR